LRGARGMDGNHYKLEALRIGHRWISSVEALERFTHSLTNGTSATARPACEARQRKVERELDDVLGPAPAPR